MFDFEVRNYVRVFYRRGDPEFEELIMLAALAAIPSITLGFAFYIAFPYIIAFHANIRFQTLRWSCLFIVEVLPDSKIMNMSILFDENSCMSAFVF